MERARSIRSVSALRPRPVRSMSGPCPRCVRSLSARLSIAAARQDACQTPALYPLRVRSLSARLSVAVARQDAGQLLPAGSGQQLPGWHACPGGSPIRSLSAPYLLHICSVSALYSSALSVSAEILDRLAADTAASGTIQKISGTIRATNVRRGAQESVSKQR